MARAGKQRSSVQVDTSEVVALASTLRNIEAEMTTNRHLNVVTKAAFEMMAQQFNMATHVAAGMAVGEFHHVYEWEHVGIPGFQLWKNELNGRGGQRRVTWSWRASKTTVPTETNVHGGPRFAPTKGFDPSRLQRIHVFVWKAPMMEYGVRVTVKPKLSHVLVFPNPDLLGGGRFGRGPRPITFSPHPVTTTPGEQVQGNFTAWFVSWWGGGSAQGIADSIFADRRDEAFKKIFNARIDSSPVFRTRRKGFRITPDSEAARQGKNIARAIAGDMEHNYIAMAARRRRMNDDDEI